MNTPALAQLFYSKWGKVQSAAQHPCQNALDGTSHGSLDESRITAGGKCRNESLLGASAGLLADGTRENQHLSCRSSSINLVAVTIRSARREAPEDLMRAT